MKARKDKGKLPDAKNIEVMSPQEPDVLIPIQPS